MKLFVILMAFISFNTFANDIYGECEVAILRDILIPAGNTGTFEGQVYLKVKSADDKNNRRIRSGLILKVVSFERESLKFESKSAVDSLCVLNCSTCGSAGRLAKTDLEKASNGALRLNCELPVIDIE